MNIILKSAKIIDPSSSFNNQVMDIQIENGMITAIAPNITVPGFEEIVKDELHISQGWFDSSVCLGEPGFEERETIAHGLEVAAKSGFTHIAVEPNSLPITDSQSTVSFIKQKAIESATEALPIGALTMKSEGTDLAELYDMQNAGAIAFGDYKKTISSANLLKLALQYTQDFDGLVIAFTQDKSIRGKGVANEGVEATKLGLKGIPTLAEEIEVARNLFLLEYTGGKMHIPTISSAQSVALIKAAKEKGLNVTCSVSAHLLCLTDVYLQGFDTRYKVLPPLRDEKTRQALIAGVLDNTIDCITSEHNPLDIEHKKLEFDQASFGTIGLESAFTALSTVLPTEVIIAKLTAAKSIFKIPSQSIEVGNKACLSLFTTKGTSVFNKENILSKSKNSAFLNYTVQGKVYGIVNGSKYVFN
ncbi:MAG: dihydroorotase [Flavobacteriaceae bacterium]|jgi:dihydroorotase|nr:dihydroorotase [Flavobacteriaceae bacterium]